LGTPSKIAISRYLSSILSRSRVLLWDWQFLSGELGSAWTVNGSTFTTNQGTNPNAERIVYRSLSNDAKKLYLRNGCGFWYGHALVEILIVDIN